MITRRTVRLLTRDEPLRSRLTELLDEAGYGVEHAPPTSEQVDMFDEEPPPDLAVIDASARSAEAGAEEEDGPWALARQLSGARVILMVASPAEITRGLATGVEDCVVVGAPGEELLARIEAVLRRTASGPPPQAHRPVIYVDSRLWINHATRQVWVRGEPAQLTPREFRLLRDLVAHKDETRSHEELLESVWGREADSDRPSEVLKQYVWRLRQKIEADPESPEIVRTESGAGYRFVSDD